MMKAIYTLKIYLFREQFQLSKSEIQGISAVCHFIVTIYIKAWFTSTRANKAPQHDIQFLQSLSNYAKVDPIIAEATVSKFINHLWYIIPEAAALSFFDKDISVECKRKMVAALSRENPLENDQKRVKLLRAEDIAGKDVSDYIYSSSYIFFHRFHLSTDFLKEDPSTWLDNPQYHQHYEKVKN